MATSRTASRAKPAPVLANGVPPLRCQVGQYARILEAPHSPENVGRIVSIVVMKEPPHVPNMQDLPGHGGSADWLVRGVGRPLQIPGNMAYCHFKEHPDTMLQPITFLRVIQGGKAPKRAQAV